MHKLRNHWMVAASLAATLLAGSWACRKSKEAERDADAPPASEFAMSSPGAAHQLVDGFYNVENNAWRWTRHSFSVSLVPPAGAAQKGATLEFRFALPESIISRRQTVTLSAWAGGLPLPPATYNASGNYVYRAEVPATAFPAAGMVKVAFRTDKYLAAGEVEARELALVAQSVGLSVK
jgi:hypothetical protein